MGKRKQQPAAAAEAIDDLAGIEPGLHSLAIECSKLTLDPANLRKHPVRNLESIKESLRLFKQQKPIVVDERGIVIAGNGTLLAARALGWPKIAAVRTTLAGVDAVRFAIADNRTAELAEWDFEALSTTLRALDADGFKLAEIGFDELPAALRESPEAPNVENAAAGEWSYKIIIDAENEQQQSELLQRFAGEGLKAKALIV